MRVVGYLKLRFSGLRMLLIQIRRRGIRVRTAAAAARVVHWQDHPERGARADYAFELDPPLEQLNKTAHDCETKSGTGLARTSFGKTLKVLENLFPALQRNPWARVIDFQHPALSAVPGEAQTYAARPRIFHGVGTEVQGDLAQLQAIAYDLY